MLNRRQFAKHIHPGQLRMFMTGPEIQTMYGPHPVEHEVGESDADLWARKRAESEETGYYGEMRSGEEGRTLRESIRAQGVKEPVQVWHNPGRSTLAEGHHRVAVAAADTPEAYLPVEHYSTESNWFA